MQLARNEVNRIYGHFSPEFLAKLRDRFELLSVQDGLARGVKEGRWTRRDVLDFAAKHNLGLIAGGANGFYITNAEAVSMLTDHFAGINAGTAAVINIYDGSVPADADASIGASTLLAQLTCSATAQASIADDTPGALATFDTITSDASANATGTASYFRILTQDAGTVTDQGTVGTATSDLILNTVAITSGSTVSITAATILLPEGP